MILDRVALVKNFCSSTFGYDKKNNDLAILTKIKANFKKIYFILKCITLHNIG